MNFEYGCQTNNKFGFFIDQEDVDPSELIARATTEKSSVTEKPAAPASGKQAAGKGAKQAAGAKSAAGQKSAGPKSAGSQGKQPLQQQADNRTGSKQAGEEGKRQRGGQQGQQGGDKENSQQQQRGPRGPRQEGERPRRGGRGGPGFTNRPPRQFREGELQNQEERATGADVGTVEPGQFRERTGPRGGRGGFRGGNPRNFARRRPDAEREFERHSGSEKTGVKSVDKKDGAGKGNWGTPADVIE